MQQPFTARDHLPVSLYSSAQVRQLDQAIIRQGGIPAFDLMSRAAEAAFALMLRRWPDAERVCVVAGKGNNGGDAYVLAALARYHGMEVCFYAVGDHSQLSPESRSARDMAEKAGVEISPWSGKSCCQCDLYVDGLLGTGLTGVATGDFASAIRYLNERKQEGAEVLSLDIPSGLCADTGHVAGDAVNASLTVTFIGMKQGMLTADGPDYCGQIAFAGLVDAGTHDVPEVMVQRVSWQTLLKQKKLLAHRTGNSHKNHYGSVSVAGGNIAMGGAALMAAEAALRSGTGIVRCLTRPEHATAFMSRCPELMTWGINSGLEAEHALESSSVLLAGPGLGSDAWAELLLQTVLSHAVESGKPLVLDADGLNLLTGKALIPECESDDGRLHLEIPLIMTPHPGEAARLLNTTTAEIQADRFAAVRALAVRYNATVILKGQGSLICDASSSEEVWLCSDGNPGMATAGMGDILAGVVAALIAQGMSPAEAAVLATVVHSAAGDVCSSEGAAGLKATDLLPVIRKIIEMPDTEGKRS